MARLVLCVLALCAVGAFADPRENWNKISPAVLKDRQVELLALYNHIHEPINNQKAKDHASSWTLENNVDKFNNVTAAQQYAGMLKGNWRLPRGLPFTVNEPAHSIEALTLFNVLYSAKDYDTFYKTAVYLRDIINEGVFIYTLSVAIIYRKDTQGIQIPPIYETAPSFFLNGEILTTAQRINTHGNHLVEQYPSTFLRDDNVVIRSLSTAWPYLDQSSYSIGHFTNDIGLNAAHYYLSLVTPSWLGDKLANVIHKPERGEAWWYALRQLTARYYLERLSSGLGEIPEITDVAEEGVNTGLLYPSGIAFPTRPNNFALNQPEAVNALAEIKEFEQRIWQAIDQGFYITRSGEKVSLLTDSGIQVLANLIEANADSPNRHYYKDFIRLWKKVLGNSIKPGLSYANHVWPLVVPSALENQQTVARDPAYYSILKRVLRLFWYWQKQQPLYKPEEITLRDVAIEKVEVDKLVTYFENIYVNITNQLHQHPSEVQKGANLKVLVQQPRLNHKPFSIKVHVKSDAPKKVLVKFFLAPKVNGKGFEIPLHLNTENFFMLDQFPYDLPAGESVVVRKSTDFAYTAKDWPSTSEILAQINKGTWQPTRRSMNVFPHNLLLPKGQPGGVKFQLVTYIQNFDGYKPAYTPGYTTIGFPTDRPMYAYYASYIQNLNFQDVLIYHQDVPEIQLPLTY